MSYTENYLNNRKQELMNYLSQFLQDLSVEDHDTTVENILDYLRQVTDAAIAHQYEEYTKPYLIAQFKKMLDD